MLYVPREHCMTRMSTSHTIFNRAYVTHHDPPMQRLTGCIHCHPRMNGSGFHLEPEDISLVADPESSMKSVPNPKLLSAYAMHGLLFAQHCLNQRCSSYTALIVSSRLGTFCASPGTSYQLYHFDRCQWTGPGAIQYYIRFYHHLGQILFRA